MKKLLQILTAGQCFNRVSTIPGNILLLDSRLSTLPGAAGTQIITWGDQSGFGNNVTQAVGGSQPSVIANQIGTIPAIRFQGSKFMSNLVNYLSPSGQPYTICSVWRSSSSNGPALLQNSLTAKCSYNALTNYGGVFYLVTASAPGLALADRTIFDVPTSAVTSNAGLHSSQHVHNGAGTWADLYIDGTQYPVDSPAEGKDVAENGTVGFKIGVDIDGNTSSDIFCIYGYDHALTAPELADWRAFSLATYGI